MVSGSGGAASLGRTVSTRIWSARLGLKMHHGGLSSAHGVMIMSPSDIRYRRPGTPSVPLAVTPTLASWDRHDHPSQRALSAFLDSLEPLMRPALQQLASPAVLALDIGLPKGSQLTSGGRDLDNYLFPIVARFGAARFAAVFARKHHGRSTIAIGPVQPAADEPPGHWAHGSALLTVSSVTAAWKQQLVAGLAASTDVQLVPPGPVAVHLAFRVGPDRNWANLWKPAIDALGGVLGVDNPARPFDPRDDRITDLGLQQSIDPRIGHAVQVDVWWRSADQERW